MASQLLPSCSSPSPVSTYVRRGETSSLAEIAWPTAIGRPWPSGPVLASTPGTLLRFGWPLSRDSGLRNVASSSTGQEAEGRERRVERAGDVALGQDEAVALGVVDVLRGDVQHRPVQGGEDVDGGEVAADVAGAGVVDQLEVLQPDLPGGLGDVGDLVLPAGAGGEPADDGHRHVLGGEGGHAWGPSGVGGGSRERAHQQVKPPSTRRSTPVQKLAASLSRKTAGPTSSSTRAIRPSGVSASNRRTWSATSGRVFIGVAV